MPRWSLSCCWFSPDDPVVVFQVSTAEILDNAVGSVLWSVSGIGLPYFLLAIVDAVALRTYSNIFGPSSSLDTTGQTLALLLALQTIMLDDIDTAPQLWVSLGEKLHQ